MPFTNSTPPMSHREVSALYAHARAQLSLLKGEDYHLRRCELRDALSLRAFLRTH